MIEPHLNRATPRLAAKRNARNASILRCVKIHASNSRALCALRRLWVVSTLRCERCVWLETAPISKSKWQTSDKAVLVNSDQCDDYCSTERTSHRLATHFPCSRADFTGREHGRPITWVSFVHPWTRAIETGRYWQWRRFFLFSACKTPGIARVTKTAREHWFPKWHPCSRPVNTGNVYWAVAQLTTEVDHEVSSSLISPDVWLRG